MMMMPKKKTATVIVSHMMGGKDEEPKGSMFSLDDSIDRGEEQEEKAEDMMLESLMEDFIDALDRKDARAAKEALEHFIYLCDEDDEDEEDEEYGYAQGGTVRPEVRPRPAYDNGRIDNGGKFAMRDWRGY